MLTEFFPFENRETYHVFMWLRRTRIVDLKQVLRKFDEEARGRWQSTVSNDRTPSADDMEGIDSDVEENLEFWLQEWFRDIKETWDDVFFTLRHNNYCEMDSEWTIRDFREGFGEIDSLFFPLLNEALYRIDFGNLARAIMSWRSFGAIAEHELMPLENMTAARHGLFGRVRRLVEGSGRRTFLLTPIEVL